MKFKWEIKPITEIVKFNPSYTIKKGMSVPYVEMAAVPEYNREIAYFDERIFSSGSKFKNGDTLFSRITPCLQNGKTAKVSGLENDKIGNGSTEFIVMSAIDKSNDEDFVYYISLDKSFRKYAEGRMEGTTGRQRVSWQALSEYELPIPPKEDRKKIAHILSTLDDKIELNRKMNQTLEEMAQALFKSLFVDFEPVHAKAKCNSDEELESAACELGISKEILDLFPSEFEESELGMIPKGWRVGSFEHDCKIAYGKNLPTTKLNESGYEVYGGNGVIGFYDRYLYERQQVLIGCRGAASGVVHISNPKSFVTNNSLIIELMENNELNFEYISELAKYTNFDLYRSGSAQPQITIQSINTHKFLVPNQLFTDKFKAIVESIHSKTLTNVREIQTLQKTRDTLLPKLLSGELDVSELELDLD